MLPKAHIAYGIVFSILLYAFIPEIGFVGMLLILFGSIFIDTDHYILTAIENKTWNLRKSINIFKKARKKRLELPPKERKKYYAAWCFFHGVETIIILFVLGKFVHRYFYFIAVGVAFHLVLDLVEQAQNKGRIDKISSVWDYFKFKKLKRI